ncbi:hypothetical protein LINGRAHAP2_LOCUS21489 [Linum grandiflorum]
MSGVLSAVADPGAPSIICHFTYTYSLNPLHGKIFGNVYLNQDVGPERTASTPDDKTEGSENGGEPHHHEQNPTLGGVDSAADEIALLEDDMAVSSSSSSGASDLMG